MPLAQKLVQTDCEVGAAERLRSHTPGACSGSSSLCAPSTPCAPKLFEYVSSESQVSWPETAKALKSVATPRVESSATETLALDSCAGSLERMRGRRLAAPVLVRV